VSSISSYPNGFANGLTVRGMPITVSYPGEVFFVNNSSVLPSKGIPGSDLNPGTYLKPFATLAGALARTDKVVASRGDILMVMPGHAETISSSTALTISVAGVMVVGLGQGGLRPTFTLDTANTSTINVTADGVAFSNCVFKANFLAIAALFTLTTAKHFTLSDCEMRDNSSILNFVNIVKTGTTSNANDGLTIERCNYYGLSASSNTALIGMNGTNDRITTKNCYVAHAAVTAGGYMPIATGKVVTNLICDSNIFNLVGATSLTDGTLITTNGSTNSGILCRNFIQDLDATTEILVTASSGFIFSQNYSSAVADKSGYLLPAADA
jgi:hypothetical protein